MTLSHSYTALHTAFAVTANTNGLMPYECRVVLALDEADSALTHDRVAGMLQNGDGAAVRRSGSLLQQLGYLTKRGADGGRSRPGVPTELILTSKGRELAAEIRSHHRVLLPEPVAA